MWDTKHINIKSEPFFHKSKVKTSIKAWNNLQNIFGVKGIFGRFEEGQLQSYIQKWAVNRWFGDQS